MYLGCSVWFGIARLFIAQLFRMLVSSTMAISGDSLAAGFLSDNSLAMQYFLSRVLIVSADPRER